MNLNKIYLALIIVLIILLVIAGTIIFWQAQKDQPQFSSWLTYTSTKGFSFQYPLGYVVSEGTDPENKDTTNIFISNKEKQGPPVLQINVSPYYISFSLWEGIPWAGYPKIIETFNFE